MLAASERVVAGSHPRRHRPAGMVASVLAIVAGGCVIAATLAFLLLLPHRGPGDASSFDAAQDAYESGRYSVATASLAVILKDDPGDSDARRLLAMTFAAQGKNDRAIEQYGMLVEADPKDAASWHEMALLERVIGNADKSREHLATARSLRPDDFRYTDELARAEMAMGNYGEAAAIWGSVLDSFDLEDRERKAILVLQGQALQSARDYERAEKAFTAALKLDPADQDLRIRVESFE